MSPSDGPLSEVTCVLGGSFVVSGPSGDVAPGGDQGFYVRDVRFLDGIGLLVDGSPPRPLASAAATGGQAVFHAYLPRDEDHTIDATVLVTRRRLVAGGLHEEIHLRNSGDRPVDVEVELAFATDLAYIFDVKHGRQLPHLVPTHRQGCLVWQRPDGVERVTASSETLRPRGSSLVGRVALPPGGSGHCCVDVSIVDVYGGLAPKARCEALRTMPWRVLAEDGEEPGQPRIRASQHRLASLVRRSAADLRALELRDPEAPEDRFLAAGSPWYLTLFGRDSLWSAFMALPLDLGLAAGTLRALHRRQGRTVVPATEEQPGKILHEVRRGSLTERGDLPPNYFGSVDATPLFVILAHEAWCWGLPDEEITALMPGLEAALGWMRDHGDPQGEGFLRYVRHGERGLANQGWKDSHDGIRFADGRIARAPMALCEVQGYAYAAARRGAELLERFGRPGAEEWRRWAARLRHRFRERFWVEDADGPYPAIALDRDDRPVDAVASNMGHLLFTGILDPDETAHVAARLGGPAMSSGFGLRTLSRDSGGYNPISYHCGSVWPHDTAIAAWGLARTGHPDAAARLIEGLLTAAPTFAYRLPELLAGIGTDESPTAVPYPASCRPQAWAAGGALLLARALLGVEPRLPDGRLVVRPLAPAPVERISIRDLRLGSGRLHMELLDGHIEVEVEGLADIEVETGQAKVR